MSLLKIFLMTDVGCLATNQSQRQSCKPAYACALPTSTPQPAPGPPHSPCSGHLGAFSSPGCHRPSSHGVCAASTAWDSHPLPYTHADPLGIPCMLNSLWVCFLGIQPATLIFSLRELFYLGQNDGYSLGDSLSDSFQGVLKVGNSCNSFLKNIYLFGCAVS